MREKNIRRVAIDATLHCLTGCAIGEIAGLIIGTWLGLNNPLTIAISIGLAFFFGYTLSLLPLLKAGLTLATALPVVALSDTLSIATMEIVDNAVMVVVPGAMNAGLVNPLFWATMPVAFFAAFLAAVPVNEYLLKKGRGHALIHKNLHKHH